MFDVVRTWAFIYRATVSSFRFFTPHLKKKIASTSCTFLRAQLMEGCPNSYLLRTPLLHDLGTFYVCIKDPLDGFSKKMSKFAIWFEFFCIVRTHCSVAEKQRLSRWYIAVKRIGRICLTHQHLRTKEESLPSIQNDSANKKFYLLFKESILFRGVNLWLGNESFNALHYFLPVTLLFLDVPVPKKRKECFW